MQIASWLVRAALGVTLAGLTGCAGGGRAATFTPVERGQANVILSLSNQSSARRAVVLAVYVDDRLVVRKEMASVDRPAATHGFPEEFPLRLAPGPHAIKVVAEGQVASASTEIVVGAGTLYVDAAYDWSPGGRAGIRIPEKICALQVGTATQARLIRPPTHRPGTPRERHQGPRCLYHAEHEAWAPRTPHPYAHPVAWTARRVWPSSKHLSPAARCWHRKSSPTTDGRASSPAARRRSHLGGDPRGVAAGPRRRRLAGQPDPCPS